MTEITLTDRLRGALYGAVVGDALGVTHEFLSASKVPPGPYEIVGGGPFDFPQGMGSDDTDLLLCAMAAYRAPGEFDSEQMIENMLLWAARRPPDIGGQTMKALVAYFSGGFPIVDAQAQGNGGLMRAAAHVLMSPRVEDAYDNAWDDTALTHPSLEASYCSASFASALHQTVHQTMTVEEVLENCYYGAYDVPQPQPGGHCVHSINLALWGLQHVAELGFEEVISRVIETGGDTDTNAAIAGALAGAAVGIQGIPQRWINALADMPALREQEERMIQWATMSTST